MLQILTKQAIATIILSPFTLRVHAGIARNPWARLWYLSRGFDPSGRGSVDLPVGDICQLLSVSRSTIYEWLRDGERAGAFRRYTIKRDRCHLWLGGLKKLCKSLGLQTWGATATVSLLKVNRNIRATATSIVTADLQDKSHYAARRSLKKREREFYAPPKADVILAEGKRSSQKPETGASPFLLHVGKRLAFVSKSFVPFGASQRSIGMNLGISEWTVRRHQRQLGLERRQLVQAKHAYQLIDAGIKWEAERCYAEPNIWYQDSGDQIRLYEPNGVTSVRREGGHPITKQRLFRYGGKTWLYRCNIYATSRIHLTSMRAAKQEYKLYLDRLATSPSRGEHTEVLNDAQPYREKVCKIHKILSPIN